MRTASWSTILVTALASIAACGGDDDPGTPDGPNPPDAAQTACTPAPPALQPGPLADPRTLPLPASCVAGGLRDLPGRWFVRNPDSLFQFQYPKYEGDCTAGFRRANVGPDDTDLSDGQISHNWSDGTIVATRQYFRFPDTGEPEFEYVSVLAACVLPDGNLAAVRGYYDTDTGELMSPWDGKPFGLRDSPAEGLELVGELGMGQGDLAVIAYNVVVDGSLAYTVGPLGLDIIDVSNPATPVHVSHVDGAFNDVKVVNGPGNTVVAFASPLYDEGTHVIDVTTPSAPVEQAMIDQYSHSVFVRQNGAQQLLYLATYSAEVPVYDVTAPLVPVPVGAATVPGEFGDGVHDLFATAGMIYANSTTAGMVAIDVSAGLGNGVEAGRIQTSYSHASFAGTAGGHAVVLHGDEGMTVGDGGAFLRVLEGDTSAGTFVNTELARYQSRPEVGIHNFVLVGDKVYIAYYHDGVRVVDVSTPTAPAEVAHYNTWDDDVAPGGPFEAALGIRVVNGLIYVADSMRGLVILREI